MPEDVQRTFEIDSPEFVSIYDELPLWSAPFGVLLLEHVPMPVGPRLLDVGCGTGFPLLELAQRLGPECQAVGLDPWRDALDRVKRKIRLLGLSNVRVVDGDAQAMPFDDASFDLVTANLVVNNVPDPAACLRQCHRVLDAGGVLAMTTNLVGHMREFYTVYHETLVEAGMTDRLAALADHVRHRATLAQTREQLAAAGFEVTAVHESQFTQRFADGTALLSHTFIRLAFLRRWREVVAGADGAAEFWPRLEADLNAHAAEAGGLTLTIPMAYVEGRKGSV